MEKQFIDETHKDFAHNWVSSSRFLFFCQIFLLLAFILGGCYALWLFNRIAYGNLKNQFLQNTVDINQRELFIFIPLISYTLILGLIPDTYLNSVHMSVNNLIENMYF